MVDSRLLRHPLERPMFAVYVALNLVILAAALVLALESADWLSAHPILAKYRNHVRAIAIVAVLSPISITFLRNIRHAEVMGNSLRLSSRQLPQLHELFMRQCARLGIEPPELYFSDTIREPARAYKSWKERYVVLGTKFLQPDLNPMLPVLAFLFGRELGRLQLGHASWPTELLLTYTHKIPYMKNPLSRVFTYSEDRWGAYLAPEGLNGLVALATGRLMLPAVNIADYLSQVRGFGGAWASLGEYIDGTPPVASRINALKEAGLLRVEPPAEPHAGTAT